MRIFLLFLSLIFMSCTSTEFFILDGKIDRHEEQIKTLQTKMDSLSKALKNHPPFDL